MQFIGFILGVLIGVSLGLIGSGGSIFAIPILVYLMNISPNLSTTYSLFIVGFSALVGVFFAAKNKLIDYKIAIYFGFSSIFSVFIMRKFLMPLLPNLIFSCQNLILTKDRLIMLVFSVLMIVASVSMIKKSKVYDNDTNQKGATKFVFSGLIVGFLTGFVGVGGGFLIIPTLLFYAKLPMKNAVATSLFIIAANSFVGFAGSQNLLFIDWFFLIEFTLFSVIGIFVGMYLSSKINNEKLKPIFGIFVLFTGVFIIVKELFLNK